MLDRRTVLHGIAGASASALLPVPLSAQPTARDSSTGNAQITSIGDGMSVIDGLGGNVIVYSADSGVILVDSGSAVHSDALLRTVESLSDGDSVRTLFNTHWHLEQVGGNAAIRNRGAELIAHRRTLMHLSTPYYLPNEDRYQEALPTAAHPTESFFADGATEIGSETIRYGYLLEAHTDGDIYVQFEADNVIVAGDAISPLLDPELDWYGGGWIGGRVDSLQLLLDLSDSDTRFIPSYGPVVDRDYVQSEHDLMLGLFDILFERVRAGEGAEDVLASGAMDSLNRQFENPMKFLYAAHKGMWGHYNTLSHDIV